MDELAVVDDRDRHDGYGLSRTYDVPSKYEVLHAEEAEGGWSRRGLESDILLFCLSSLIVDQLIN